MKLRLKSSRATASNAEATQTHHYKSTRGMRTTWLVLALFVVVVPLTLAQDGQQSHNDNGAQDSEFNGPDASFEKNLGQWDSAAHYLFKAGDYEAFLAPNKLVMVFTEPTSPSEEDEVPASDTLINHSAVFMHYIGSNLGAVAVPEGLQEYQSNYLLGNEAEWITGVPHFTAVTYQEIYPGIDVKYYGAPDAGLKYDFIVKPGASTNSLRLRFEGADELRIDPDGSLVIQTSVATHRHAAPYSHQQILGRTVEVPAHYAINLDGTVSIIVAPYDSTKTLIVDPLIYSTFLGGNGGEFSREIAIDSSGNAYIAGSTTSTTYPTTSGAYQTTAPGSTNLFVTKLNPAGSALVYSTYIGGSGIDDISAMTLDAAGNVYIAAQAGSTNFPVTAGAYQTVHGPTQFEASLTKLNPSGNALAYSTFFGFRTIRAVAVDSNGNAFITGGASNLPTTAGAYQTALAGTGDAYVAQFNPSGSALVFATYLGGTGTPNESGQAIALDAANNVYIAGVTGSGFPTTAGAFRTTYGGAPHDTFAAKLNSAGSALLYSTYLGGNSYDYTNGIAVDSAGNTYLAGITRSSNFPTTAGAFQTTYAGGSDGLDDNAFLSKLNPQGTSLLASSLLGGTTSYADYQAEGLDLDSFGNLYLAGRAYSKTGPHWNVFAAKFAPSLAAAYLTHFGDPTYSDFAYDVAVDGSGVYLTGGASAGYPTTSGSYRPVGFGVTVTKLSTPPEPPGSLTPSCGTPTGTTLAWQAPASNGGSAVIGYRVYRSSDGSTFTQVGSPTGLSFVDVPAYSTVPYSYRVAAINADGESLRFATTSFTPCDSQSPTANGAPVTVTWRNSIPTLAGVSWQDTYSGLAATVQYSVGTTSGGITVVPWTTAPAQPTPGYTMAWSPSWSPSTLAEGMNYVNMRVTDRGGAQVTTNGAYQVQYDTALPTITGSPVTTPWQTATTPISGVTWTDPVAGLATTVQYSIGSTSGATNIRDWATAPAQPNVGQTSWAPLWTPSGLQPGTNYVNMRVLDQAGNQLQTNGAYIVRIDATAPTVSGNPFTTPWTKTTPSLNDVTWLDSQSGLSASAEYSIGSTSGGTNIKDWTAMPSQPGAAQTSWTPNWSPSGMTLPQGLSYVNVRISDSLGQQTLTNGAYVIRYDALLPSVSGNPQAVSWRNSLPSLTGVTWTDATSGLAASVQYSVGTTLGGITVVPWTNLPTQPSAGFTDAWTPNWSPSTLEQGLNYVNVRVTDQAGNQRTTDGAYTVQYDTALPTITGNPVTTPWQTASTPITGVSWTDALSGLATTVQYSIGSASGAIDIKSWTTASEQPNPGQTLAWTPSWTPTGLQPGVNYVNLRVLDRAGNQLQSNGAYIVRIDATTPTISTNPLTTAWGNILPTLTGVAWQDPQAGLAANAQYSIGSTSGDTNVLGWTTLPTQPQAGTTEPWTPDWTPSILAQGTNYINVQVSDALGNTRTTDSAYIVEYDTVGSIITGSPSNLGWRNAMALSGVSWQDSTSGLASVEYSVGTTSGGITVVPWTAALTQPSSGQTTAWPPAPWSPSMLVQGTNYVNMRVTDRAGNLVSTDGAYQIQYDPALPTINGAGATTPWQAATAPVSGVTWGDGLSGLAPTVQYSIGRTSGATDVADWATASAQPAGYPTSWAPSWTPENLAGGVNHVNVRVTDRAGNLLTTDGAYIVRVDANAPTVTSSVTLPWSKLMPTAKDVTWQDVGSGLANAKYSIGTTPGATGIRSWTAMTVQPSNAWTDPWTPTWTFTATLPQGLSYINTNITDVAGFQTVTPGAYVIRYDTANPTVTGAGQAWTWRNTIPSLSGVSWLDTRSGLNSTAEYSVGSTSGGVEVLTWRPMPVQPNLGTTSTWAPTNWSPSQLGQGKNYINVRVTDLAGNQVSTPGAYTVEYDTIPVASTPPQAIPWRNTPATLDGVTFTDPHSGLQANVQYSVGTTSGGIETVPWTTMESQPSLGLKTGWTPNWSPSLLAQGMNYVNMRLTDVAGNVRTIPDAYTVQYETAPPTVTGNGATTPWQKANVPLVGVTWTDALSGLAASAQYSVGSSSGATNILTWTAMPSQPTAGALSWAPTNFVPSTLNPGTNHVNVRVWDVAGNLLITNSAWIVRADSVLPAITARITTPWASTTPTLSNVSVQDSLSGLAPTIQYSIGTTNGTTNIKDWTTLPSQPNSGLTDPWPLSWTPSVTLQQGLNWVNVRMTDLAGNELVRNGAYVIQFDDSPDVLTGLVAKSGPGGTVLPSTWQPDNTPRYEWVAPSSTSPLGYSITQDGTDPDGIVEQTATFLDLSGAPLGDGVRVFKVRAKDQAGNLGPVSSVTLQVDASPPALMSLSSPTHPLATAYYNQTNATVAWSYTDFSGLNGYYYAWITTSCPASLVATGTPLPTGTTSLDFTGLAAFASYRFCIQAVDNIGNAGAVSAYTVNVDTVAPTVTSMNPVPGSRREASQSYLQVNFADTDGGLDPMQGTTVDPASVQLLVDDVDILAIWGPLCGPDGPLASLCEVRVTSGMVRYQPLVAWATGNHTVELRMRDTAVVGNSAVFSTHFITDYLGVEGSIGDFDGDQVTDSQESLVCSAENSEWEADGSCTFDGNDWLPPHLFGLQKDVDHVVDEAMEVVFP